MQIDFYGFKFEAARITCSLVSPWRATALEHRLFNEIKQTLSLDGVVLANINGTLRGRRSRIMRSEYKTLATVFPNVYLFPHLHETER